MPVRHPAKFTDVILDAANDMLNASVCPRNRLIPPTMYDPFAGTGKGLEYFQATGEFDCFGTELEQEWADQSPLVVCRDSLEYMECFASFRGPKYDVVFTSPAYGNRMADHHEAKDTSKRNTYRHALGRPLTEGTSAGMQWGDEYRAFHAEAWGLVFQVLKPGGWFLLNVKDHIRKGAVQLVSEWHREACWLLGFEQHRHLLVGTPGNRQGANGEKRVEHEHLLLFRKAD